MRDWEHGVLWCLGAVVLYLVGWSNTRDADILKAVLRINQLSELEKLVDSEGVPLVVGISGTVCSENPINCEFGGLRGVLVEQRAEQKFLKRDVEGDWIEESALMLSTCKEVPWYLYDGTGRVNVVGAQGASGFKFPASSGVFEQSRRCLECETERVKCETQRCLKSETNRCLECETNRCLKCVTIDDHQGLKLLGVKRIEWVLPIGTSLSVVGEAVKDTAGTIRIQKPKKGPFYVSPKSIDELIASSRSWARSLNYTSFGLAAIGFTLIAVGFNECTMERKRRSELQKSLARAVAAADIRSEKENEGSEETLVDASNGASSCVICLEQEYSVVFVPCGHICCCTTCCLNLRKCPLCRQGIAQVVRTFRP